MPPRRTRRNPGDDRHAVARHRLCAHGQSLHYARHGTKRSLFYGPNVILFRCFVIISLCLLPATELWGQEDAPEPTTTLAWWFFSDDEEASDESYAVEIDGPVDDTLRDLLERSSQLISLRDNPPSSRAGLANRINTDLERFRTVLRSEGYWDGTVEPKVDLEAKPIAVRIHVDPGPRYRLSSYNIELVKELNLPLIPSLSSIGVTLGEPARGAKIVAAGQAVITHFENSARPLARQLDRTVVVEHWGRKVDVDVAIDPGPPVAFGPTQFKGLETVKEDYARQWITWRQGDPFDARLADDFRNDLLATGLFSSVSLDYSAPVEPDGERDLTVTVIEADQRSVGVVLGYSTDRGVGGRVFWRHRNLFGHDEDLEISARADFLQQSLDAEYERPNWRVLDQRIFGRVRVINSDTDAFKGFEAASSAGVAWPLVGKWEASIEAAFDYSDLDDVTGDQRTWLLGSPAVIRYRGQNDDLNPTEGIRFDVRATPYIGNSGDNITFLFSESSVAGYQPFDRERRYVLAARALVGSIVGENTLAIPANKRIYAGGGGSIRGYAFQSVGPLEEGTNTPIGGRSKIELTSEIRARVWGDIGVVAFVAGGQTFDRSYPDFSEPLRWAAGFGLRYYTSVGPLRFDMAFPINRRIGIDDAFQIYLSLGQAF